METIQTNDVKVIIKSIGTEGILMRDTKEFTEKGEEIKTTEYFLDVNSENTTGENAQFIAVEGDPEVNDDAQFVAVEVSDSDHIILHEKEVILWNELCRICANGSDRFIPIFSGEGLDHNLCNKINTYLPLEVSINDTLPLHICYNCAATLLAWHDMFKGCFDAQQRLTELQTKLKDQYYNDSAMEETTENVLEVESENCGMPKDDEKTVNNDEIVEVDDPDSERSKDLKRSSFKEFQKSFKPTHPAIKSRKKSQTTKPVKKRTKCSPKKQSTKKALNPVVVESGNVLKQELNPDSENSDSVELKLESSSADGDDLPEPAPSDNGKPKKSRVRRAFDGVTKFECNQCQKKFSQYNSYQIHMRLHTGEKPYTCHICGKQFSQTGSLYYHLKHVHGGVKNHACDICGRCFAMKTAMEDHRRIHTGERPYVCDSCGKTFKTKASLYIHGKIHTNEYPFKCSFCKKLFRWKQQMISHLTTHTGEKNHICDICGKGFGVKNELTRHRRTHSLDKPFTCQKCGVSFAQKRYLTNHNRTRHKIKATSDV